MLPQQLSRQAFLEATANSAATTVRSTNTRSMVKKPGLFRPGLLCFASSSTRYSGQRAPYSVASGNCAASRSRVRSILGPVLRVKPISLSTHLCRTRLASQVSLTSVPDPTASSS